jgi:Ca-activated chloride channel homolog
MLSRTIPAGCIFSTCCILSLASATLCVNAQTSPAVAPEKPAYSLSVAVDEVSLTLHAADIHGLPVNDLKAAELRIRDNGKPPAKILAFEAMQNFPIRAGILIDTSESMRGDLAQVKVIAAEYAQQIQRQQTDQALVMEFGYSSNVTQPWTNDANTLVAALRRVTAGRQNPLGGTALFDTLFKACFTELGKVNHRASGNFLLLFSDGEDTASHTSLAAAVDACQRSNTAIYAFHSAPRSGGSSGPATLAELAEKTGGKVFFSDDFAERILANLRVIEANLRNQYLLVYKPAELPHNGAFHSVEVLGPDRVSALQVRTGYYAPQAGR